MGDHLSPLRHLRTSCQQAAFEKVFQKTYEVSKNTIMHGRQNFLKLFFRFLISIPRQLFSRAMAQTCRPSRADLRDVRHALAFTWLWTFRPAPETDVGARTNYL